MSFCHVIVTRGPFTLTLYYCAGAKAATSHERMPCGKHVCSCCKTVVYNVVEYMERMDKKKGCRIPVLKRTSEATGEFLMMIPVKSWTKA